jgi:hypothetical protein
MSAPMRTRIASRPAKDRLNCKATDRDVNAAPRASAMDYLRVGPVHAYRFTVGDGPVRLREEIGQSRNIWRRPQVYCTKCSENQLSAGNPIAISPRKRTMSQILIRWNSAFAVLSAALSCASLAIADDMVSFATGGYARGLRTMDEMHKIDTDGDGTVSKAEWLAYQEKIFVALDKNKTGVIDEKEFLAPSSEMATFATGGYARGLQTREMMHKIDTDGDGTVSHDEFIAYETKVFDMMDKNHTASLGPQEFLGK